MAIDYRKILLLLGIALIPFYEIVIRLLPSAVIITPDTRVAKAELALLIAMLFGLVTLAQGVEIKISNKWLLALIGFILISINRAIHVPFILNGMDSSSFWVWKPAFKILTYFVMFVCVTNITILPKFNQQILKTIYWTALAMTFYVFFQWLGFDQFYQFKGVEEIGLVENPGLIGNLGQPTLLSPYLGVGILSAIWLKRYVGLAFMVLFLLILDSKMAIGATFLSILAFMVLRFPKAWMLTILIILTSGAYIFTHYNLHQESSGRINVYNNIIEDLKTSPVADNSLKSPAFTGIGLGSYGYWFPEKHKSIFRKAHSDPLEILYCLGFIGLGLYLMANYTCLKGAVQSGNRILIPYISIFLLLQIISCGTFIFQLGVYQYLAVLCAGILSNQSLIGRE